MVGISLPLFLVTIPSRSIPKPLAVAAACFVGLIKDAIPDLIAFAPSAALIPPSFIATSKTERSLTSPPIALITGPVLGMASVKS